MVKNIVKNNKTKTSKIKVVYFFLLGFILLFLDQLTKFFIFRFVSIGERITIIPGFLWFSNVHNTGASFGILQNSNAPLVYLYIMVFGLMIFFYDYFKSSLERISYVLFMSGLLGNLLDRFIHGFVVDFIDLGWWPVFNVADSCLVIGVILLIIAEFTTKK